MSYTFSPVFFYPSADSASSAEISKSLFSGSRSYFLFCSTINCPDRTMFFKGRAEFILWRLVWAIRRATSAVRGQWIGIPTRSAISLNALSQMVLQDIYTLLQTQRFIPGLCLHYCSYRPATDALFFLVLCQDLSISSHISASRYVFQA